MKKIIIITAVISLSLGIVFTITGYFVYKVVKMQEQLNTNTQGINQIVNYLNSQMKPETK